MVDLDNLLEKTSRTFALAIPMLPEPTRREMTLAYLLFRVADTFEDASTWPREQRTEALDTFCDLLDQHRPEEIAACARRWEAEVPIDHEGYQELLRELPAVLEAFFQLAPDAREQVRRHTVRTARGMAGFVTRADEQGELHLSSLQDLRDYCYVVAGIVGEICTELFLLDRPELLPVAGDLRQRARDFGEGLQLVNILKDSAFDATEGRRYLPSGVQRNQVFALARADLEAAAEYVSLLEQAGAERGLIAFNALPALLAWATLDHVEHHGAGTKISRDEVFRIVACMDQALDAGTPVMSACR